jgi:hypothetical protein
MEREEYNVTLNDPVSEDNIGSIITNYEQLILIYIIVVVIVFVVVLIVFAFYSLCVVCPLLFM